MDMSLPYIWQQRHSFAFRENGHSSHLCRISAIRQVERTAISEKEIPVDRVELEKRFDDIIPDIVVYSGDKYFFIEIYVTHPIDDEKLKKLKEKNISTIEIDLSKIKEIFLLKNCRIFCSSPAIGNRGNIMLCLKNGISDLKKPQIKCP